MNNVFDHDEEVFMLETDRLLLRGWHEEDLPAWIAMNADEQVRRHFPDLLAAEITAKTAQRSREALPRTTGTTL